MNIKKYIKSQQEAIIKDAWSKKWFQFILDNPDKPWIWVFLSENPNITWQTVCDNPDKPWNWSWLSKNPNITWQIVRDNPDKPWDWSWLTNNPNITREIICDNPDKPWKRSELSMYPNITCGNLSCNLYTKEREEWVSKVLKDMRIKISNVLAEIECDPVRGVVVQEMRELATEQGWEGW